MSDDKLISILETDFKKAFTFEFDFNNESNELKMNQLPCPNGEFDQKSIEKYNDTAMKEINRQMAKLREIIKANKKSFNEKKIDEWINEKNSAFSKLKSIVLASVKKNNVILFSSFCSNVPVQNLYDLIFNVNKLILSIVVSKLKLLVDFNSTNEHLKHQIVENEKKIAELKKEHDAIIKEHTDKSGKITVEQQAELDKLNKQISDNEKRMVELESEHERKIKDTVDNSDKMTNEQKQKQHEELDKLNKMIAEKEQMIEHLHAEHKQKIEGHEATASQFSDTQKKELEELKQTLDKLKAENKHLTELNVKRDKFEKDGINKLVNIIKTAQNLVDVNDTQKPVSNDRAENNSNIPPPPPLDLSNVTPRTSQESPKTNFLNELNSPDAKARLKKTQGPSINKRGELLKQIVNSPRTKKHTSQEVLPLLKPRQSFKEARAQRQAVQKNLSDKETESKEVLPLLKPKQSFKEARAQRQALQENLSDKEAESKYLKYKNKYLQLKKLHNL